MCLKDEKQTFGQSGIIDAISAIGLLGYIVRAHHIFPVCINVDIRAYFTTATIIIAVPTAVYILSWIATLQGRFLNITPELIWAIN